MTEPRSDLAVDAVDAGRDELVPVYRFQVTSTLKTALGQGRLTEDEYDERVGQAAASQSRAELAALIADLPVGQMNARIRPPTSKDVWIGVGVTIAAAGVVAAILLSNPDNGLAFMAFILAAVTLLVAPIVTVDLVTPGVPPALAVPALRPMAATPMERETAGAGATILLRWSRDIDVVLSECGESLPGLSLPRPCGVCRSG